MPEVDPIRVRAVVVVIASMAVAWPSAVAARPTYAGPHRTKVDSTPSPTPSSTTSPSPSPSASPTPSASPSPSSSPAPASLQVTTVTEPTVAQLGDEVRYTVTVTNAGAATAPGVSVVDLVPLEVDVIGVPINSEVQATELGRTGRREDIVWEVGPMVPGQVLRLTWTGKIVGVSGLDAVNTVTARSRGTITKEASVAYLANAQIVGATNPPFHATRTVVTYEPVGDTGTAVSSSSSSSSSSTAVAATDQLPFTGARITTLLLLALALALSGAGLLLIASRRPDRIRRELKAFVPLALLVVLGGCVSSNAPSSGAPRAAPSVKGRHIESSPAPRRTTHKTENKNAGADNRRSGGASNPSTPGSGPVATGPIGVTPPVPAPAPSVVAVQHEVPITAADLPIDEAPQTDGSDQMTYSWNAQGGYISTSTSTRTFESKDVSVTGSLSDSSGAIHVRVAIKNLAKNRRMAISGHVTLEIRGSGISQNLISPAIEVTLTPGGAAHARFDYALPTGTYATNFSFVPAGR